MQNKNGWSALMLASYKGHCGVAKLLIEIGAQVDLQNNNGSSSLMKASQNGHSEIVKLFYKYGAQVDMQNKNGWSALMIAICSKQYEIAKLLQQFGAPKKSPSASTLSDNVKSFRALANLQHIGQYSTHDQEKIHLSISKKGTYSIFSVGTFVRNSIRRRRLWMINCMILLITGYFDNHVWWRECYSIVWHTWIMDHPYTLCTSHAQHYTLAIH